MNKYKDEKWLDELISGYIDTSEPKFDAEKWRQKYSWEFQSLVDRRSQSSPEGQVGILSVVLKSRVVKVAAAVIIVAISFFIIHQQSSEKVDTNAVSKVTISPTDMLTVASLNIAYRKGGLEAVEAQFEKAHGTRKPRATSISLQELLN